jgi:hypothetical protein
LLALLLAPPSVALGAVPPHLPLSALPADDELARLLWEHGPDLVETRTRIATDGAALQRSRLVPNPELDVAMATIPVGTTNPPGPVSACLLTLVVLPVMYRLFVEVEERLGVYRIRVVRRGVVRVPPA